MPPDQELKLYDWCCNQAASARLCARYGEKRPRIGCDGYQPLGTGRFPAPVCRHGATSVPNWGGTSQPPPVNATKSLGGSDGEGQQHPGAPCSTQGCRAAPSPSPRQAPGGGSPTEWLWVGSYPWSFLQSSADSSEDIDSDEQTGEWAQGAPLRRPRPQEAEIPLGGSLLSPHPQGGDG